VSATTIANWVERALQQVSAVAATTEYEMVTRQMSTAAELAENVEKDAFATAGTTAPKVSSVTQLPRTTASW
jgi:hypothetical protein